MRRKIVNFDDARLKFSDEEWLHFLEQRIWDIVDYARKDFKSLEEISEELYHHSDGSFEKIKSDLFTTVDEIEIERIYCKYIIQK